jgi:hypothetical protein
MFFVTQEMRRNKECDCNRSNTNYGSVKFEINGSSLELKCIICDGLVGWWDGPTIMPLKRTWSEEESLAMR